VETQLYPNCSSSSLSFVLTAILNSQAGCRCTLVPRLPFPVPRSRVLVTSGSYSDVARKLDVSRQSAKNVWEKFVDSGEIGPRDQKKGAQTPPKLTGTELEMIEFLKRDSPSMPLSKIYDGVDSYCAVPGGTSKAAISRAITKRMSCGPMTWKRTSNRPIMKFSLENVNYCQDFLDYMSTVDPCKIKCFDEAGFKMPDVANPNYGNSAVGEPCIEVKRYMDAPNVTLQVLAGVEGILYANTGKNYT